MSPVKISIVNHKGGVLKTSITLNLGAALAERGYRVLLVDLDAQQNLTQSISDPVQLDDETVTLLDCLIDEYPLSSLIKETNVKNLDIVPNAEDFAGAELSLVNAVGREGLLSSCLEKTPECKNYDFIFFDNPPSISLVVMNSLVASDLFLVPCSAEYLPMVGLTLLGETIGRLDKVAPNLRPLGVVITKYHHNETICREVAKLLKKDLGSTLFDTKIRVNTKAKSAPSVKKTVFEYESSDSGRSTQDFRALAEEFLTRIGFNQKQNGQSAVGNG
jgi:chromosome partitioning protein